MGSASGPQIEDPAARASARKLGNEIAKRGFIFINGACPGLPNDALLGAKEFNGFTVGVSPAFSEYEHINEYRSPHAHDMLIYTGLGFMERDIINIRSSDAVIIVGGGIGSLNEFTIAYEEGRPIGILTNTGGISNSIPHIVELCQREMPLNLVMDDEPVKLLDKIEVVVKAYPLPIREDGRVRSLPKKRKEEEEAEEHSRGGTAG